MSDRRKAGNKNRVMAYIAAAVVHLLLIGAFLFNFSDDEPRETINAFEAEKLDTVKASVIDESQIKDQQEKLKKAERERQRKTLDKKKRQLDELKKIQQQTDQEQQKVVDLQDKQKLEQQNLERQREAIALKKKKDQEQRKKDQKIAKKKAVNIKKYPNAEVVAEEERDLRERQRVNKLVAEEDAERQQREADRRAKERTTTVMSQYSAKIEQAIKSKWRVAPGTESWRVAKINIKLSPDGRVLKVVVINSSGSQDYDRSLETAVLQASPLPFPTVEEDASAHQILQDININVKQ